MLRSNFDSYLEKLGLKKSSFGENLRLCSILNVMKRIQKTNLCIPSKHKHEM